MAHTFTRLYFHIIFSTKHRQPFIDLEFEERLHPYLGGIIREMGGVAIRVGGVADHVHLLAQLPATLALADVVRDIKANSSAGSMRHFPHAPISPGRPATADSPSANRSCRIWICTSRAKRNTTRRNRMRPS